MKRRRFEDRLERELLAAARRQAEESGAPLHRGRLRVAAGAAAAVATLAAVTLAVVLISPGDAPPPVITGEAGAGAQRPTSCAGVAGTEQLGVTERTMPQSVYDAIAVLRRPQTAAEREICPAVAAGPNALVNPAEVRDAGLFRQQKYGRLFVATRWFGDQPQICVQRVPHGVGSGGCQDAEKTIARGYAYAFSSGGTAVYHVVVPDGVAAVELRRSDGPATRLPVRANVARLLAFRTFSNPQALRLEYDLLDADGAVLSTAPVVTSTR